MRRATVRSMDETWRILSYSWERFRWSRINAGFERMKDAAVSLGVKQGTYRTWEHSKADGGREPSLSELQKAAKKFKVSWVWLLTGIGTPHDADPQPGDHLSVISRKVEEVPEEKREDAINAVIGVLEAFRKRA